MITDLDTLEDILQGLHAYFMTGEKMPPWREAPLSLWAEFVYQCVWAAGHARATADHLMESHYYHAHAAMQMSQQESRMERAKELASIVNAEAIERRRAYE